MAIAGILFDKDGTLFDFEATFGPACAAVLDDLAEGDAVLAREMAATVEFDLDKQTFSPRSLLIAGSTGDLARLWSADFGFPSPEALASRLDALFMRYSRQSAQLFPGVDDILRSLAASGYTLGIATNDSQAGAVSHAAAASIEHHFAFIAGYDSGHGAKPGPGMVEAFARHCTCPAGQVMMVGDSLHDMHAARAAGAIAVAVTTGPATGAELAPSADHVLSGLDALPALAEKLVSGSSAR